MAVKPTVHFFLEDNAQESIIPPLFKRLIVESGKSLADFDLSILHSRGGKSVAALKSYLTDAKKRGARLADCAVVGSDANCKGFTAKRDSLLSEAEGTSISLITVVPDPHVERWYMLDSIALSKAVGESIIPHPPQYKCGKNEYKTQLRQAFIGSSISPLSGGVEYGPEVANHIDLYHAAKLDPGFGDFVQQTQRWLKSL